jgi:hypothetical protein
MNSVIEVFNSVRQGREGDETFQYWNLSLIKVLKPTKIPFTLIDEARKSALSDSVWGLRLFNPWFLSGLNSASNDDFLKLMVDMLDYNDDVIKKHMYWFIRGDCNIFKMWIKV